jgi:hypothetical protein
MMLLIKKIDILAESTNTNVGGSKKKGASSVLTGVQEKFSRTK